MSKVFDIQVIVKCLYLGILVKACMWLSDSYSDPSPPHGRRRAFFQRRFTNTSTIMATTVMETEPSHHYRAKVVLIVPMRDREAQWLHFGQHMCAFWSSDNSSSHSNDEIMEIFGVRQNNMDNYSFNRGWLFNVGLQHVLSYASEDTCIAMHDVDLLPLTGVNYTNCVQPTHLASETEHHGWKPPYDSNSGGVFLAAAKHWRLINGVSNKFWGWGGEDDEMFHRWQQAGLTEGSRPYRPPVGQGMFKKNIEGHFTKAKREAEYQKNVRLLEELKHKLRSAQSDGIDQTNSKIKEQQQQQMCLHVRTHEINASLSRR